MSIYSKTKLAVKKAFVNPKPKNYLTKQSQSRVALKSIQKMGRSRGAISERELNSLKKLRGPSVGPKLRTSMPLPKPKPYNSDGFYSPARLRSIQFTRAMKNLRRKVKR